MPPIKKNSPNTLKKSLLEKKIFFEVLQNEDLFNKKNSCMINEPIKKIGCIFQGFVDVTAKLDKPYYYPDDVAQVIINANNSFSMVDIQCIRVTLNHHLEVRTSKTSWSFTNKGASLVTSGLASREKRTSEDCIKLKVPLAKTFGVYRNNTQGKLITNSYIFDIEVFLDNSCLCSSKYYKSRLDLRIVDESGRDLLKLNETNQCNFSECTIGNNESFALDLQQFGCKPYTCILTDEFKIEKQQKDCDKQKQENSTVDTENGQTLSFKSNTSFEITASEPDLQKKDVIFDKSLYPRKAKND